MKSFESTRRRSRGALRAALVMLFALCCALTAGCRRPAPEAALREAVASLQSAIEARDADGVGDALADDFIGNDALDRDGARRLAALMFMQSQTIGVSLGPLDVALQGERATVRSTAALTGGAGRLLPDSAGLYDVVSGWRLADGEWRMSSVEWTRR